MFKKLPFITLIVVAISIFGSVSVMAQRDLRSEKSLRVSESVNYIPNNYIVKVKKGFKPDLKMVDFSLKGRSKSEKFLYVEYTSNENVKSSAIDRLDSQSWVEYVVPDNKLSTFVLPNDTNFNLQWAHRNIGQSVAGVNGVSDMDVDSDLAWDLEQDALDTVTVGVIDTGIAYQHPDLQGNLVQGWDFIDNDNAPYDYTYKVVSPSYTIYSHGSHVSGIVGAVTNNGTGIAGVSFHNNVKVMPLRVDLSVSQIVDAIEFADLSGVKVLNGSFGTTAGDSGVSFAGYLPMYEAIRDYSGIFVAAAGNSGANIDLYPVYPASYDLANLVTVGAIGSNGSRASYSNFGVNSVDIYAPGSRILSTVPVLTTTADEDFQDSTAGTNFATTMFTVNSGTWAITQQSPGEFYLSVNPTDTYQNNVNQSITLTTPLNTSGVTAPANLRFFLDAVIEYSGSTCVDYLQVSIDNNDNNWTEVARLCGTFNSEYVDINLNTVNPALRIRFTWYTNGSVTGLSPIIDDIELRTYRGAQNTYVYLDGTSMAAPLVAGQIAMMKAQYIAVSNADLIDELKLTRVNSVTNSYNYLANGLVDWGNWTESEGRSPNGVATYNYNGKLYQSVGGNNGFIYLRTKDPVQSWGNWGEFGGYTYSNPDFEEFNGCLYLNVRGRDNGIYIRRTCDGTTWSKWASYGGATFDGPVLESHGSTLFQSARGRDNTIYIRSSSDGTTWGAWYAPGGATSASPSLISYDGKLSQYVRGSSNNTVWVREYISGNSWSAWQSAGFESVCPVAFEVFETRLYQAFCRPSDTSIMVRSYAPGQEWTVLLNSNGRSQKTPSFVTEMGNLNQYVSGNNTNIYMRYGLNRLISGFGDAE
jgi:subtilisin family serine protease